MFAQIIPQFEREEVYEAVKGLLICICDASSKQIRCWFQPQFMTTYSGDMFRKVRNALMVCMMMSTMIVRFNQNSW